MNNRALTLGSLFDGSGTCPLAAETVGIKPVWASEIEPYPIAVTRSHFPEMRHLGDITKMNGAEVEPVDIITFGSPCQNLSVAGNRAGLAGEKSSLFMEAVRIIREMRCKTHGKYPQIAIWENVPGAFSSNKGEDFRVVLEELIKIVEPTAVMSAVPKNGWPYADSYCGDGWSLAYRTYDAQYWGVPQRRRRIYLVLDLRGQRAGKVSFEREGVRRNFATFKTAGQGTAGDAADRTGADDCEGEGNCLTPWDVQSRRIFTVDGPWPALYGGEGGGHGYACVPYTLKIRSGCEGGGKGALIQENKSATLLAAQCSGTEPTVCVKCYDAGGNGDGQTVSTLTGDHENRITDYTSVVCEPIPIHDKATRYKGGGPTRNGDGAGNGMGVGKSGDPCPTLSTCDHHMVCYCMAHGQAKAEILEDKSPCLNCNHEQPIIFDKEVYNSGVNATGGHYIAEGGPSPTLRTYAPPGVCVQYIVRRLTPTECARLQGFPDDWGHPDHKEDFTDEEYRFWLNVRNTHAAINGKPQKDYTKAQMLSWYNNLHTDSAEYKMWGNGMAFPCVLYVMEGVKEEIQSE